ncbi:MAG: hypothetical protein GXO42_00615 [bacterium]|nr:hypothetical protein [bacterium]
MIKEINKELLLQLSRKSLAELAADFTLRRNLRELVEKEMEKFDDPEEYKFSPSYIRFNPIFFGAEKLLKRAGIEKRRLAYKIAALYFLEYLHPQTCKQYSARSYYQLFVKIKSSLHDKEIERAASELKFFGDHELNVLVIAAALLLASSRLDLRAAEALADAAIYFLRAEKEQIYSIDKLARLLILFERRLDSRYLVTAAYLGKKLENMLLGKFSSPFGVYCSDPLFFAKTAVLCTYLALAETEQRAWEGWLYSPASRPSPSSVFLAWNARLLDLEQLPAPEKIVEELEQRCKNIYWLLLFSHVSLLYLALSSDDTWWIKPCISFKKLILLDKRLKVENFLGIKEDAEYELKLFLNQPALGTYFNVTFKPGRKRLKKQVIFRCSRKQIKAARKAVRLLGEQLLAIVEIKRENPSRDLFSLLVELDSLLDVVQEFYLGKQTLDHESGIEAVNKKYEQLLPVAEKDRAFAALLAVLFRALLLIYGNNSFPKLYYYWNTLKWLAHTNS